MKDLSPDEIRALQRRTRRTLFATQAMGSAGFLVAATVTPIVGARLSGHPSWAGVPTALYWAGGAVFATIWGRLLDGLGRRRMLATGLAVGIAGASVATAAIRNESFWVFAAGLVLMGAANASLQFARFMAGEVHSEEERGRAISTVVLGGTFGAVLGPAIVAPTSRLFELFDWPGLAGPYVASAFFFAIGASIVFLRLFPDPAALSREVADRLAAAGGEAPRESRALGEILRDRRARSAIVTLALGQSVMTMLMVITSLHMAHHDHGLSRISLVISLHVLGMYAFSTVAGRIADARGRGTLIAIGGALLFVAGLGAAPSIAVLPLAAALFLLGLGWNFCYVGGSTLLADRLRPGERGRVQGLNDALLTGLAGLSSALSGVVFSQAGYAAMGIASALVALVPLGIGLRLGRGTR
jgi:MFS family permease